MSAPTEEQDAREQAPLAYLLLTMTMLCWGGNAVFGQLAVDHISPMLLVTARWLGVVVLSALFLARPIWREWPRMRPHLGYLAIMGAIGFACFNALFYIAAHSTSAVNVGILQGSIPVFVLIGALVAYRTPIAPMQLVGVGTTVLGVATVASAGSPARLAALEVREGDLLMLAACALYACYTVGLRRRPPVSTLALFPVMAAAALVVSLPLTLAEAATGTLQWPTTQGWVVVGLVTLLPSFLAQLFFIGGVDRIGPGRAGVFANLVPVFAAILAVLILGETFRPYHGLALGLVLTGIWLSERYKPMQG